MTRKEGRGQRLACGLGESESFWQQVFPSWVRFVDQRELVCPGEALQSVFSADGVPHVAVVLEVHEPVDVVFGCVGAAPAVAVYAEANGEVVGHAGVESAGAAGEDVDPEVVFALHATTVGGVRWAGNDLVGEARWLLGVMTADSPCGE